MVTRAPTASSCKQAMNLRFACLRLISSPKTAGYATPPVNRSERASNARSLITTQFNSKQQAFLDFVLSHYVNEGVGELDPDKLPPLLKLKYQSISDALLDLGSPEEIGTIFTGFQKYLYQPQPGLPARAQRTY